MGAVHDHQPLNLLWMAVCQTPGERQVGGATREEKEGRGEGGGMVRGSRGKEERKGEERRGREERGGE